MGDAIIYYMSKIFISIASLRDPTLEATMRIALKNADCPENIIFGVGAQYYDDEMPDFKFLNKSQLRLLKIDPDTRPGVVKLRYEISKLIQDEDYFLSIDSHMLFKRHWDTKAISWIKELQEKTGNKKVCVTNGRMIMDQLQSSEQVIVQLCTPTNFIPGQSEFHAKKANFPFDSQPSKKTSSDTEWFEAVNVTPSFLFAPIEIITEMGLDPYSQFCWEEQYLSFRIFMSGFDSFIPANDHVAKHYPDYYYYYVWPDISKHYWTRLENQDSEAHDYELQRAMTTNEPGNRFSIENSPRTVREFWSRLGQGEIYDKYNAEGYIHPD
jgi:hypothetical protein